MTWMTPHRRSVLNRYGPQGAEAFRAGGNTRARMSDRARQSLYITPLVKNAGLREVVCLLGEGTAVASSDGGWSFVARPKVSGFTTWEGRLPYVMTIPVMFDGFATNTSQEGPWEDLRTIFRESVGPERHPSPVSLTGAVPLTNLLWVIQSIDPTEELRDEKTAHRIRIQATITVMQYSEADVLIANKSPAAAAAERNPAPAASFGGRTYVVKKGDTLSGISQRLLGSYKRYREIAALNGIRDPNRIQVGQTLRIPQ